MKFVYMALLLVSCSCPKHTYKGAFLNITKYRYNCEKASRTPDGIRYFGPVDTAKVDRKVAELEKCLMDLGVLTQPIDRTKIGVMVPPNWYKSTCTGQQLIPSSINYKLCEQKGVTINKTCRYVEGPTKACPCPCNARSAIQDNWLVVTTPDMKLFKAELARLVLWPQYNNPWTPPINSCLR